MQLLNFFIILNTSILLFCDPALPLPPSNDPWKKALTIETAERSLTIFETDHNEIFFSSIQTGQAQFNSDHEKIQAVQILLEKLGVAAADDVFIEHSVSNTTIVRSKNAVVTFAHTGAVTTVEGYIGANAPNLSESWERFFVPTTLSRTAIGEVDIELRN